MYMNEMFDLSITPELIALYSVALAGVLFLMFGFRRYVAMVSSRIAADSSELPPEGEYPGVSVIVYSQDDAWNLEQLLRSILTQDYPGQMEVIVVNDGAMAATEAVIGKLEGEFGNLYMTFTPVASRNLSRKKLAVTLGVKAARYEVVVLTGGACRVNSADWLRRMARHFVSGKEVVIGYAAPVASDDAVEKFGDNIRAFDTVYTAMKYLSWAIAGRPFRGSAFNLAYRRSLFFKNKGFSKSLTLKYGDDDIFLSEISTGDNTAVELSEESIVEVIENNPPKAHREDKLHHDFTGKYVARGASRFFGFSMLMWWAVLGCLIAGAVIGLPSLIPAIASVVLFVATAVTVMLAWKKCSVRLHSSSLLLTVPFLMLWEPIYNIYYRIIGRRHRDKNMSWTTI